LGVERPIAPERPSLRERMDQVLDPLSKALPLSPGDVSRTRTWLIQAGFRERRHLVIYVASRILGAVGLFALTVALVGLDSMELMAGAIATGFFLPRIVLKRMIRQRQREITVALPDALDLTGVCVR